MQISENFSLHEFLVSDIATRAGYELVPDKWIIEQLTIFVRTVMQPIRKELGVPIVITSGYRPAWLNRMVNGSTSSMHLFGCAADWKPVGMTMPMAFKRIKDIDGMNVLPIDQCILEFPPNGWIHTGKAYPGKMHRRQFMIAERRGGRVVYDNA